MEKTYETIQLECLGELATVVINRPEAVLRTTREEVAKTLGGIPGLLVPRVHRFRGGDPDAPLREAILRLLSRVALLLHAVGIEIPLFTLVGCRHGRMLPRLTPPGCAARHPPSTCSAARRPDRSAPSTVAL
mgnify:CR=1 FL=1